MQRLTQKPSLGTRINWSHPLAKGMRGCWLFNEGGGNRVYDLAGNDNHGILTNMTSPPTISSGWNPGNHGTALAFDANNDYVTCGIGPTLDIVGAISIETWVNVNTFPADGVIQVIVGKGYDGTDEAYYLRLNDDVTVLQVGSYAGATGDHIASWTISGWNIHEWHHIVGIYDGSTWRLYFDGVEKQTNSDAIGAISVSKQVVFGAADISPTGITRYFDGLINNVRIYNRGLSAQEVLELYENPYGMFAHPMVWMLEGITAVSLAGSLTGEGAILRSTSRVFVGALSNSGTIASQVKKVLAGAQTYAGTLVGKGQKYLLGASTFIGTVRSKGKKVLSGALTSSGVLIKKAKTIFAGALTSSGVLARKAKLRLTGAFTSSGILRNKIFKTFTGVWTNAGVLRKKSTRLLVGALTEAGVLRRSAAKTLVGAFSSAGTVVTAFIGNVILLVGAIGYAGDLYRKAKPILRGDITPSGIISRFVRRVLAGALSFVSRLLRVIPQPATLTLAPRSTSLVLASRSTTLTLPSRGG